MKPQTMTGQGTTRRAFLGGAALAAGALVSGRMLGGSPLMAAAASGKPCSVFKGVRIGCITYSYRGGINSAEDTLKALLEDGLSEVELMGGPIQSFAGIGNTATPARAASATGQVPGAA